MANFPGIIFIIVEINLNVNIMRAKDLNVRVCHMSTGNTTNYGRPESLHCTAHCTVVELNSDLAPLIISKIFRFRVLWSKSKSMSINKWMLSVRN